MTGIFTAEEAADYLRQMADALEQGRIKFDRSELEIEGAVQVKGALRSKPGKTSLKLKLKFVPVEGMANTKEDAGPEVLHPTKDEEGRPYKKLKKRMNGKLKEIRTHLKNNRMPPTIDLESFYRDCITMTEYPGKGDEFYKQFNTVARRMRETARSEDPTGLADAVEVLEQMKKDCHNRYK